tara:strand:+ start:415 stop:906 length:492 start_codon:yes stop_codon:yes gene_type:complete
MKKSLILNLIICLVVSFISQVRSENKEGDSRFKNLFKRENDFFSLKEGYTLKKFEEECKNKRGQIYMNKCSYIDVLFMKDNLREYLNNDEIENLTKSLYKTCHVLYKAYKKGSIYSFQVNSCVGETLNNLAKYGAFPVSPVWVWKGSEYKFIQTNKYEIPYGF